MKVSPIVLAMKAPQPRFGQLFKVEFTNAPPDLPEIEHQRLLEDTANLLVEKLSWKQKIAELIRSAVAVVTHSKAAVPRYDNFFMVREKAGEPHHYVVMGKHHQELLQFLEQSMIIRRQDRPTPDMFHQWLVTHHPDQVLKVRLVKNHQPEQWEIRSFHPQTHPQLPESAEDIWQRRW